MTNGNSGFLNFQMNTLRSTTPEDSNTVVIGCSGRQCESAITVSDNKHMPQ